MQFLLRVFDFGQGCFFVIDHGDLSFENGLHVYFVIVLFFEVFHVFLELFSLFLEARDGINFFQHVEAIFNNIWLIFDAFDHITYPFIQLQQIFSQFVVVLLDGVFFDSHVLLNVLNSLKAYLLKFDWIVPVSEDA